MSEDKVFDVAILGAGAAGLFCAHELSQSQLSVALIEVNKSVGKKILISGGGRCNFTNKYHDKEHLLCENEHFFKSPQAQYSPYDFIYKVEESGIEYYEKKLGQLFCKTSAKEIVAMLTKKLAHSKTELFTQKQIKDVQYIEEKTCFLVKTLQADFLCRKLVVATGGLSIPSLGASSVGYHIAKNFGHQLTERSPALVPLTLDQTKKQFGQLSGVSLDVKIQAQRGPVFYESLLFTHKGLSGPAVLQVSNYWYSGESLRINFLPELSITEHLNNSKKTNPKQSLQGFLKPLLPNRFIEKWIKDLELSPSSKIAELSAKKIALLEQALHNWEIVPTGTEGYRKAEVTRGGVDVHDISSQTMESKLKKDLYFIGEVMDVTGHLGGHNFQWAWSSAFVCANALKGEKS